MSANRTEPNDRGGIGVLLRGLTALGIIAAGARWLHHAGFRTPQPTVLDKTREHRAAIQHGQPASSSTAAKVIGSFADQQAALNTVKALGDEWSGQFEVYSPNLNPELVAAMHLPQSPVRAWILAGGIIGQMGGWVLCIMLSIYWPHPVAGMPVIAVPPFAIISFEMMVLFAANAGVVGLMFYCRLPKLAPPPDYLDRFKQDRTGIILDCKKREQILRASNILRQYDADEILYV